MAGVAGIAGVGRTAGAGIAGVAGMPRLLGLKTCIMISFVTSIINRPETLRPLKNRIFAPSNE